MKDYLHNKTEEKIEEKNEEIIENTLGFFCLIEERTRWPRIRSQRDEKDYGRMWYLLLWWRWEQWW